mmetsp:Transcript_51607/g.154938  ORF Transcript_51607/g.154938 Transcript_51607/m.154938 type:complete len:347 (-) Transcript_51607:152-1192(-)
MLDIFAKNSILIQGLDIHVKKKQVTVTIYTRPGSYVGHETDKNGWTLMLPPTTLHGQGKGRLASIPSSRFIPMLIEAGRTRAFYIKLTTADLLYSKTAVSGVGDVLASNTDLNVLVGAGLGSATFGKAVFEPRAWNGAVKYKVESHASSDTASAGYNGWGQPVQGALPTITSEPSAAPSLTPTSKYKSFVSDMTGDNGSFGNMFTIIATSRDAIIRSMAIHVGTTESVTACVRFRGGSFRGYETEPVGWVTIMPVTQLDGKGYLGHTEFPEEKFRPVKIPKGKIGSFYVTLLQKSIRYTNWDGPDKSSFVGNSDIGIIDGVGVGNYPFGAKFENRMWNGIIRYEVE